MKILSARTAQAITICTCALLIGACSNNNDDLYQFIQTTKTMHVGSVKPIPKFEPYKNFTYSAEKLRDPFEPSVDLEQKQKTAANSLRPDRNRPREPLEAFPLDTLSMVGILEQQKNLWGLIKDPQGIVHRVQVGNYIGQNEGRITEITDTDIRLNEIVPDGIGGYIERDASIAIGTK
jgi:type IV pilus assembly protein PilP